MALEDRDRNFEKALARQLRSSASSGVEANASAGAPLEACPDPEILAGYHEQSLSHEELSQWKNHVVCCNNCQFVLAQLVATDKLSLDAAPAKDSPLVTVPASSSRQPSRDAQPVDGARRPPSWRWVLLIPAGAIAAGLVAYISLQPPKSSGPSPVSSVEVAENRQSPAISPPAHASPSPRTEAKVEAKEKDQSAARSASAIAGAPSTIRDKSLQSLQDRDQLTQQSLDRRSANASNGPSISLQKQQQQQLASRVALGASGGAPAMDRKKLEAPLPPRIQENGRLAASSAPPPPPPMPQEQPSFVADGSIAAPSAEKAAPRAPASNAAAPTAKSADVSPVASTAESVEVTSEPQVAARSRADAHAMLRASALQNPHVFFAPDGKHLWRLGPAGSLEHSTDGGIKWKPQESGVSTDLLAASAPAAKVCWVVGNSGTILRTTDGGSHWIKLESPITNDISGVRATDALHAVIWFLPDQHTVHVRSYQTEDGGVTWLPAPSK